MINKFKKLSLFFKIVCIFIFTILLVITIFTGLVTLFLYRESRENDRLPVILSDQVKMLVVNKELYQSPEYINGEKCTVNQLETAYKFVIKPKGISFDPDGEFPSCLRYSVEKGTFYWLRPHWAFTYVIFEKRFGEQLLVIYDNGKLPEYQNIDTGSYYPGSSYFNIKGDGKDIIFTYSGWNNPEKVIKLSVN